MKKKTAKMKCRRCGKCCARLGIDKSPTKLKAMYTDWVKSKNKLVVIEDIYLIYPMLRFIVYDKKAKLYMYSCIHREKKKGKATCGIQSIKPKMCSQFPYGMKSNFPGCGYNKKED